MRINSISAGLAVYARTITPRSLLFRGGWIWIGFLALVVIALGSQPAQAAVTEAWVQRYGSEAASQDNASASKVVTDAAGNVIVAGSTVSQTGSESHIFQRAPRSSRLGSLTGCWLIPSRELFESN